MSKNYICDVTVCFGINNFEANNEKEYIQKVKNSFEEQYNILRKNIRKTKNKNYK